jgi:hypothetical protein
MLVGRLADRAALYGFIARIDALGLELVELQRRPTATLRMDVARSAAGTEKPASRTTGRPEPGRGPSGCAFMLLTRRLLHLALPRAAAPTRRVNPLRRGPDRSLRRVRPPPSDVAETMPHSRDRAHDSSAEEQDVSDVDGGKAFL